jgi:hypothetical protein
VNITNIYLLFIIIVYNYGQKPTYVPRTGRKMGAKSGVATATIRGFKIDGPNTDDARPGYMPVV